MRRLATSHLSRHALVFPALAGLVGALMVVMPHLSVGDAAAGAIVFFGATALSLGAIGLLSGERFSTSARASIGAASAALLVVVAKGWVRHPAFDVVTAVAQVGIAHALGASIGRRVESAGHLLPVAVVAACSDVVSVLHPRGPTNAIVHNHALLKALAFAFPVPGASAMAPALGVGDLLIVALALGVARVHGLSTRKLLALAVVGALASGMLSMLLQRAVPAIPAIGAAIVLGEPRARRLEGRDRRTAAVGIALAVAVSAAVLLRAFAEAAHPAG